MARVTVSCLAHASTPPHTHRQNNALNRFVGNCVQWVQPSFEEGVGSSQSFYSTSSAAAIGARMGTMRTRELASELQRLRAITARGAIMFASHR